MSASKAWICGLLIAATSIAAADTKGYYGVVESYGDGKVVIRTKEKSVGTWTVDAKTKVEGKVEADDWVHADVEPSGHITKLVSEEHATAYAGVIEGVKGNVLTVKSANESRSWNLTPETAVRGAERGALKAGDNIKAKVYKNHNLAEVMFVK